MNGRNVRVGARLLYRVCIHVLIIARLISPAGLLLFQPLELRASEVGKPSAFVATEPCTAYIVASIQEGVEITVARDNLNKSERAVSQLQSKIDAARLAIELDKEKSRLERELVSKLSWPAKPFRYMHYTFSRLGKGILASRQYLAIAHWQGNLLPAQSHLTAAKEALRLLEQSEARNKFPLNVEGSDGHHFCGDGDGDAGAGAGTGTALGLPRL